MADEKPQGVERNELAVTSASNDEQLTTNEPKTTRKCCVKLRSEGGEYSIAKEWMNFRKSGVEERVERKTGTGKQSNTGGGSVCSGDGKL